MDIGSFLLLLALIIAVGTFIAGPLRVRRGSYGLRLEDHEISELLAERERVLESLEELDLDYAMGKVPEDLYPKQREFLVRRGAHVYRLLDERAPADDRQPVKDKAASRKPSKPAAPAADATEEDALEAMIAARKDSLEDMIAARKAEVQKAGAQVAVEEKPAKKPAGKFCPNCGEKLQAGDRFCASCGNKL